MNETELLKTFRETRSETAFAELVRRYAGLVYSVAHRRLADTALAEDVTQMVFIRLAKAPPHRRGSAELAAWLHRTTVNVAVDVWRTESRRRAREQTAVIAMETNPATDRVWEEISPQLDESLNQLEDEDRQALLLRFFEQKSMREVGASLGVSEDAAKMRVGRAMDRLREKLKIGQAAMTSASFASILAERSVEAVPLPLMARLTTMKLPAAGIAAGTGVFLGAARHLAKLKLALGVVGVALLGLLTVALWHTAKNRARAVVPETSSTRYAGETVPPALLTNAATSAIAIPATVATSPAKVLIFFRVVDAETGLGLPNTAIHAHFFGPGGMGESHELRTDDDGEARIPEPDDATKNPVPNIFVLHEGYVPKVISFRGEDQPTNYTMKIERAQPAGGWVVDDAGKPVAGVEITVRGTGNIMGQRENMDFQYCSATSDRLGGWTLNYLPRNISTNFDRYDASPSIHFQLKKKDYALTHLLVPGSGIDLTNLTLVIDRGSTVKGQITDSQGHPVVNARITTLEFNERERISTTSDYNGFYVLTGLAGETTGPKWTFEHSPPETNEHGSLVFKIDQPFYGFTTIVMETNNGVVVPVREKSSWPDGPNYVQVLLGVQADWYAPQQTPVDLTGTTNTANFTLLPGNILRGRVVNEAGVPLTHAIVQTDYDFKNQIQKQFDWQMETTWNGLFEWDLAPTGKVCYWFEAPGYKPLRGYPIEADGNHHEIVLKRSTGP